MRPKLFRKILSLCIISAILILTMGMDKAGGENLVDLKKTNEFDIKVKYRTTSSLEKSKTAKDIVKDKFKLDSNEVCSDKSGMDLEIRNLGELVIDGITPLEGEGSITIGGKKHSFKGEGQFYPSKTEKETLVLEGKLKGYLDNNEDIKNYVIMALFYTPHDGKCLINATFGGLGSTNEKVVHMSFGEVTESIKEACNKRFENTVKEKEARRNQAGSESIAAKSEDSSLSAGHVLLRSESKVQAYGGVRSGLFSWISYPSRWHTISCAPFPVCVKAAVNESMAKSYVMSVDSQAREMTKGWDEFDVKFGNFWCFDVESVSIEICNDNPYMVGNDYKPHARFEEFEFPVDPWFWLPDQVGWLDLPNPLRVVTEQIDFTASSDNTKLKWDFCTLSSAVFTTKKDSYQSASEADKGLKVSANLQDNQHPIQKGKTMNVKMHANIGADTGVFVGGPGYAGMVELYHNTLFYKLNGNPIQFKHSDYDLSLPMDKNS